MTRFSVQLFDECICEICLDPRCDGNHSDAPLTVEDTDIDAEWHEAWLAEQEAQASIIAGQYPA